MPRGSKPGERRGGRQKGVPNRKSSDALAKAAVIAEAIEAAVPGAFEGDAHAFLMSVYKDPSQETQVRVQAASKAIGYEKPALSSVEAKVMATIQDVSEDQLDAEIRALAIASGLAGDGATEH